MPTNTSLTIYFFMVVLVTNYFVLTNAQKVKIGILYDRATRHEANIVQQVIQEISIPNLNIQTLMYEQDHTMNQTEFLFDSNVTAVLSVIAKLNCTSVQLTKRLIPFFFVARSLDSCDRNDVHDSITYLFPSNFALISALNKTTNHYQWNDAIVLEKQNNEIQFGFSDLQFTREQGIETIAFEATEDEASLIATLKMAKKEGLRTYILTSSAVSVSHVMKQADIMQLTTGNFHWYIPNVFVDPESFPDIAKKGLRLTSLTSPVITPLVRRLMLSYGPTTMTQEEQQRRIYDDVIKGLTRLAVDVIAKSCQNRKPGCTVAEEICRPLPNDIDLTEYTPGTATGSGNPYGTRRRRDVAFSNSLSSCQSNSNAENCKQISTCYTQGTSRGQREGKPVTVIKKRSTSNTEVTSRLQKALHFPDVELVSQSCSNFKWPQYLKHEIAGISGRVTDLSPMSINYNASVDVCRYKSTYKWAFKADSCSHNLVARMQIEQANMVLVQEYSRSNDKLPVTVGVYNWDKTGEFNPLYHPFTLEDIKLPERQIRVCAVWRKPWLSWKEIKGETKFEGFLYDVIEELSKHLNFTYDIIIHPYFAAKQTATEDEIERMIYEIFQNGTCDFFLNTKSLRGGSLGQSDTADASLAYQHPSMYLLTKRSEKTESISIWQFMTPFREESWLCLWSSYILISLLMAWINKNNPFEYQKIAPSFGPNSSPADHLGVLNSLWFTFSSIVQQGVDIVPRSRAAKTLTGAWWFFGLTIITAYTANMTLFMTQGNKGGIKTLDALSTQIEFAYGILEGDPILTLFLPHAKERPYTVIYNYFKRNWNTSVFATQDEAFAEIQKGNFYLLSSFESTVDALSTSCTFDKVGTGFYQYQFALPFPKGSLLLPVFNDCIARLRDIGILTTLEEKCFETFAPNWMFLIETKCEQDGSSKTLENQLDIKAFTGMYVFLLLGCGIGGIFCLIETGYVSFGGIRGLYGNARFYEFQENRREHRKTLDQLEKEFEGWEGGWEVWKFKEWSNDGDHNALKAEDQKKLKMKREIKKTTQMGLDKCGLCGKTVKEKIGNTQNAPFKSMIITSPVAKNLPPNDKFEQTNTVDSGRCSIASGIISDFEEREVKTISEKEQYFDEKKTFSQPSQNDTTFVEVHPHPLPEAPPLPPRLYPDFPSSFHSPNMVQEINPTLPISSPPEFETSATSDWSSTELPDQSTTSSSDDVNTQMGFESLPPPRAFSAANTPSNFMDTDCDWTDVDDIDSYDEY